MKTLYILILSLNLLTHLSLAQEKINLSNRAPIEFILLFENTKKQDFENIPSEIKSLNTIASQVSDINLKRIIKHSIYLSLLKIKPLKKTETSWKQFLEKSNTEEKEYFLQWLKKAIEKDIHSVQKIQSVHDKRIKQAQFQKYLDPLIQLSLNHDKNWLHLLRLQLLESLPAQLTPFQEFETEASPELLLKFEKPTPKRSELLNKLIDSL